ncbi:MAG: SCO family protein [Deltaproteobacteria bacterium]|nr:SCO family protein [Deltaproteobacteria bacterium]
MRLSEQGVQRLLWAGLILVLLVVLGAGAWSLFRLRPATRATAADAQPRMPVYGAVPEFSLLERSGRRVGLTELRGKVWVATFIYTHCSDTCPLQSAQMARLQGEFAAEIDFRLVSISVDPGQDTPPVLSQYAERFGADRDRWLFLTGEKEAIHRLVREGFRLSVVEPGAAGVKPPPSRPGVRGAALVFRQTAARLVEPTPALAHPGHAWEPVMHSPRFVLVDRRARIRGHYESSDAAALRRLRRDTRTLLHAERP